MKRLEELGQWEKLEAASRRYGLPHIPEYDVAYFRKLYYAELREALAAEGGASPASLARRGRVKRLLGDAKGAEADLKAALDAEPALAPAHAWLGELDLSRPEAVRSLDRALESGEDAAWRLYRGAALQLAGDLEAARADFEKAARLDSRSCLARLLWGLAEERLGRKPRALALYQEASERDPVCSAAHFLASRVSGRGPAAWEACEKAMDADPDYALAFFQMPPGLAWSAAMERLRRISFEEAEAFSLSALFEQEVERYSPYHFENVKRARALMSSHAARVWPAALLARAVSRCPPGERRGPESLSALEEAARRVPGAGWVRSWRALILVQERRLEEALAEFDAGARLQPFYHRTFAWRGALLRKLGRPEEALSDLDRAVSVDEEYPFVYHERSLARRAVKDWAGAALDLDRAFRLDHRYSWAFSVGRDPSAEEFAGAEAELGEALAAEPGLPSLWAWRGQLRWQRRELSAALADLEKACHLDPHHALAHGWLGRALLESGNAEAASAALARAAELEPGTWIFSVWRAEAEFSAGRRSAALRLLASQLSEVPSLKSKSWCVLHLRGSLLLSLGRAAEALRDARRAVAVEGRYADGHYLEASALLALGRAREAEAAVEKALVISPNLGRGYVLRARVRQALGRHDGVVEDYRAVKERFPYLLNEEQRAAVAALLEAAA